MALIKSLRIHGKGGDKYDNVRIGMNSRLDTIQAAVLQVKFDAFKKYELADVNKVAKRYDELLKGYVKTPTVLNGHFSSWAQYSILLKDKEERNSVQAHLKESGIPSMIYYPKGMHSQKAFKNMDCVKVDLSVTESVCERVLALPLHPYMTEDDQDKVVEGILGVVRA